MKKRNKFDFTSLQVYSKQNTNELILGVYFLDISNIANNVMNEQ